MFDKCFSKNGDLVSDTVVSLMPVSCQYYTLFLNDSSALPLPELATSIPSNRAIWIAHPSVRCLQMDTVDGRASSAAGEINIDTKAADDDLVIHIGTPSQHHHDFRGRLTEGIQFKHYHSVRVLGAALHSLLWLGALNRQTYDDDINKENSAFEAIFSHPLPFGHNFAQPAWILCRQYWHVLIHHGFSTDLIWLRLLMTTAMNPPL